MPVQNNHTVTQKLRLPLLILLLVVVNALGSLFHARIDLTEEKRFTLGKPTLALLRNIKEPVTIDVFLKGSLPSGFRQLAVSSEDILQEFREVAGKKVNFKFLDPQEKPEDSPSTYGDSLSAMGLVPIPLTSQLKAGQQQTYVFPFALVHAADRTVPVALFPFSKKLLSASDINSASAMMEFQLADAIRQCLQKEKPIVAYTISNGEPQQANVFDLVENVLKAKYELFTFDINRVRAIPDNLKVLVMVKPTVPFSDDEKFKLDQYVMRGGKLLLFIDRLDAEMDSLQIKNEVIAYDRDLRLFDLLFRYGVRINPDLVMDLQCDYLPFDVSGTGQFEFLPWNYFPVLQSSNTHPVNRNIGFVAGRFVNSLDTVEAQGIRKTILLTSSANARTIGTPSLISGQENVVAPEDKKYNKKDIPAAVLLEGRFRSLYSNRLSSAMRDTLSRNGIPFMEYCQKDNKIIVVGDGDIALNSFVKGEGAIPEPIGMGMNPFTYGSQREFPFANRNFVENCLDYLVDEGGLSELKGKEYKLRLLNTARVRKERAFWEYFNLLLPVAALGIFGVVFQWSRKRKYKRTA